MMHKNSFSKARLLVALTMLLLAHTARAEWVVNADASQIAFVSVKNDVVGEAHQFTRLSGALNNEGQLRIEIDLQSVATGIDIRDERMRSMLFEVTKFPLATFTATLTPEQLARLQQREVGKESLLGLLSLHGVEAPINLEFLMVPLQNGDWMMTTTKPVLVSPSTFGLEAGVEALRGVAGLQRIAGSVPVSVAITLRPSETTTPLAVPPVVTQ